MDPSAPPSFTSDNENNSGVPAPPPPPATNPYAANLVSGGPMCSPTATTGYGQATAQPYPMAGTIGGYPPQQSNIPGTGCTPSQPNNMQVSGNLPPQPTVQGYGYPLSQPNAQGFGYSPQQPNAQGFGYSPQQPNMQGAIYPPPQAPYPGYGPPMSIPSAQPGYPPQTQFSQSGYGPQITGYANPTSGNNYGGGGYPSPMTQQQNLNNVNPRLNTNMSNLSITGSGVNNKGMPLTRVELKVHAKNLLDRDTFSKSDPVCVVYSRDLVLNQYVEVGKTEQIKNNLNPVWDKKFLLDYRFEERQFFKFAIYDWDGNSNMLSDHDFLGSLECSLGEIVAAPNKKFERNLELPPKFQRKTSSSIVISAEELGTSKEIVHIKMNARGLDKKDWFGKSDPYVMISKKADDGSWSQVHKTEIIKQTLDPDWHPFTVKMVSLTSGNPDRPLRFQVYDWDNDGSSDFIGEFETTYNQIVSKTTFAENRGCSFPVVNAKKKAKNKKYTSSGAVNIEWLRVEEEKSFLDYIQSGVQIHFTVAVDFTASNGDPNHPSSLHYRNPHQDNQYVIAIKAVGEIIEDYDTDKSFPALGFGGKIPPDGRLSHEFYLNGSRDQPHCLGTGGILDAYFNSLNTVQLYGPTYFAPIINHVARFAKRFDDGNSYFVLLIITDGIICDMDATKEAIIEASTLPMSIIIIGVGQEDFSAMEFLDSDGKVLRHNGKAAVRDIVQFVELQKFIKLYGSNQVQTKSVLAKEVLAEIPDQLVEQMRKMSPK